MPLYIRGKLAVINLKPLLQEKANQNLQMSGEKTHGHRHATNKDLQGLQTLAKAVVTKEERVDVRNELAKEAGKVRSLTNLANLVLTYLKPALQEKAKKNLQQGGQKGKPGKPLAKMPNLLEVLQQLQN